MVNVELDIFSGRPNPQWTLSPKDARQLIERVRADPSLLLPLDAETGGLGYRGFIISARDVSQAEDLKRAGLPARFRLGGRFQPEAAESASFLLHTAESARLEQQLRDPGPVLGEAEKGIIESTGAQDLFTACNPIVLTSDTDFTYWNDPAYRPYNNCYNYASNFRSNTFAQPGRATGQMYGSIDCAAVGAAALRDGWRTTCRTDANYNVALVIWPNYDYHWYRLAANGHWCHKPGGTAARNTDNSGNLITNVETCNRGGYTVFCTYYFGYNVIVS